jgi:vacuolar-type H+-ATPase subunit I/STV1
MELHTYKSAADLTKELDEEVSRIKTLLGEYLRRLDESRVRVEKIRKTQEALNRLTGGRVSGAKAGDAQTLDLMGLKVIINVSPEEEANTLEESVKTLQDKLNVLQRVRKALEPLSTLEEGGTSITAVMNDGIPTKIMLRIS